MDSKPCTQLVQTLRRGPISAIVLVAAMGCLWGSRSFADQDEPGSDRLRINGFGTAGLTYVDAPDGWSFSRNLNQQPNEHALRADVDSRVGLQLNYSASDRFELVGQIVASRLDDDAKLTDAVELAFVAFRPNTDWTLRFGRVNMDAYALSDHRDVGFAYEFIRPPVEFYSRLPVSLDGMDVARVWTTPDAQWRAKLIGGTTSGGTGDGKLHLRPLVALMLSRESEGLLLRASLVHAKFDNTLKVLLPLIAGLQGIATLPVPSVAAEANSLAGNLALKGHNIDYLAGGAVYDRNGWLFSAEINKARVTDNEVASFTTGYASAGRRFGAWTLFGIHSVARRDGPRLIAPDWATALGSFGPAVAQQAQYLANAATFAANGTSADQQTSSLGMRWDLSARLALKAQWDHVRVEPEGGGLWRPFTPAPTKADVIGVALDFVF